MSLIFIYKTKRKYLEIGSEGAGGGKGEKIHNIKNPRKDTHIHWKYSVLSKMFSLCRRIIVQGEIPERNHDFTIYSLPLERDICLSSFQIHLKTPWEEGICSLRSCLISMQSQRTHTHTKLCRVVLPFCICFRNGFLKACQWHSLWRRPCIALRGPNFESFCLLFNSIQTELK